jgi:hypothetical protein
MKPKKCILQVRLSDEEHAQLQQLAADAGMTMFELVRAILAASWYVIARTNANEWQCSTASTPT